MPKTSAGLLMYRGENGNIKVLLIHPGSPFWKNKDLGACSIPKGEINNNENELDAAKIEFFEETGFKPEGNFIPLNPVKQKGGKIVRAWAFKSDCDPEKIKSAVFKMEWPPKSGVEKEFPEVDRAGFFGLEEAAQKINQAQAQFLEELKTVLVDGAGIESRTKRNVAERPTGLV